MTTTMPPNTPGSRRVVPRQLDEVQRERLRSLLHDPDTWVLRPGWERFLRDGDATLLVDPGTLTRDHRIAAMAWLRQQRHALHAALEDAPTAPPGWLEALPLYQRLRDATPPISA
jgi:hypothetical protein